MCYESSDVVRFDLGPLPQGQTRIARLKSAYNSLFIALIHPIQWTIALPSAQPVPPNARKRRPV